MPFIASLGRRACVVCRKVTPAGESVYQGDVTGMIWCVGCAEERHLTAAERQAPVDRMTDVRAGLQALAAKYRWDVPRSWHEREGED